MPKFLLDTNVLGDITHKKPKPDELINWIEKNLANCFISAITLHELEFGSAHLSLNKSLADKLRATKYVQLNSELIRSFSGRVVPLHEWTLVRAAWLRARAERLYRDIGISDAIIAATAEWLGACVVTRNTLDFRATGVSVIDTATLQISEGSSLSEVLEPDFLRKRRDGAGQSAAVADEHSWTARSV